MLAENSFQLLGLFGSADYRCGNMYFESVIVHWNGWFWAHHCLSNEKLVCIQWQTQHVQSMPKHFSPKSTLPTPAFLSVVIFLLVALIPIAKWNRKKKWWQFKWNSMDLTLFYTWCKTENYESHQSIHDNSRNACKLVCKPSALIGSSSRNPILSYQTRKKVQIQRGKRNRALFIFHSNGQNKCAKYQALSVNGYQILHLPVWVSNTSEIEYWYQFFKKINIIMMDWTVLTAQFYFLF